MRVGNVVFGCLVVLLGVVLAAPGVPGPGIAVILAGLGFLALEFDRAERLIGRVIIWGDRAAERAEAAPRWQKLLSALLVLLASVGFVAAALLWDIPLLPV